MPHKDDQLKKRQDKREAQRKKREAEAKRLKRTAFVAIVALIACGFGIYKLTQKVPVEEGSDLQAAQVQATEAPRPTRPIDKDPITKIHIKAAGDLNITNNVVKSGLVASGYDFSRAFLDVTHLLSDADLTVMNFEGNIYGEPYGTKTTSAPIELAYALRSAGVDLVQMANSCAINNGLNGLTATLNAIRGAGIEPVGAYATASELRTSKGYTITEVQGIKVAFVAFTKGLGGRGMPAGNENLVNLLYTDYSTEYKEQYNEHPQIIYPYYLS